MLAKRLRGALVGAGDVSRYHLYGWKQMPQVQIVAIADPNLDRAQGRATEAGIEGDHVYGTLENLLACEVELDFVDIAAPPEAHLELVRLAAARGLHILCQKPFAPTLPEAWTMTQIAEQAGVTLNINDNWRWRPWFRTVKTMLDEGKIGRPVYARFFAHADWWLDPAARPPDHRFRYWERTLVYDWGIHLLDVLRFFFGMPERVYARLHRVSPMLKSEDHAVVVLEYDATPYGSALTALVDIAMASYDPAGHSNRTDSVLDDLRIEGDAGTICLVPDLNGDERIRLTTATERHEQPVYSGTPHAAYRACYAAAQAHFIDCLRRGMLPENHARDNIETLAIMLAAYHAAEQGGVVQLADYMQRAWSEFQGDD